MFLRIVGSFLFVAVASTAAAQSPPAAATPPTSPNLTGAWALNPALTQKPEEIGFSRDWANAGASRGEGGGSGGGRGGRGGSGGGGSAAPPVSRVSADDSIRDEQLTGEARTPPAHLTIIQRADAVLIADDQGHSRTFHPNGHIEELTIGTVALPTTARWDAGRLVVVYEVAQGRQLRYTFSPSTNPALLLVSIRFIERGREGDEVRLTYEPPDAHDRAVLASPPGVPASPAPPAGASSAAPYETPPSERPRVLPPGSELRGLTTIGTVVDELGAQAAACGLDQAKIKTSIAHILADAGFKTKPYGDEESYVVISVSTSKLSDGLCVSRYDASLVSDADATFPYLKGLVALPVQLLHEGGMAGGSAAAHASSVMDGLAKSVTRFVAQIRTANK